MPPLQSITRALRASWGKVPILSPSMIKKVWLADLGTVKDSDVGEGVVCGFWPGLSDLGEKLGTAYTVD